MYKDSDLNRALTYSDIDYLLDYWYGFYCKPVEYSNLPDIINQEIDKRHKSE